MIVVIGAGLIGLSIAYELAARGADVRLLDAGEAGHGASWAGAGILAPLTEGHASATFEALCLDSFRRYPEFVRRVEHDGGVDVRLRHCGLLEVACDDETVGRLRTSSAEHAGKGYLVRFIDALEARSLEPELAGELRGASFSEVEGSVDNRRLGRALRAACIARGVRLDEGVGEVAVEADKRRALGVRTSRGFAAAEAVVNAAGAWAGMLQGVPSDARVAIAPIKGQMFALMMPRAFVRHIVWGPGAYLVPRWDGRLLVGATVERAGYDRRVTAGGIGALISAALRLMPALSGLSVAETWAGLRPGTPDGLPYIGATALEGYFVAGGHYRNGILLAPATASAIADVIERRDRPDLVPFSPLRQEARASAAKETA